MQTWCPPALAALLAAGPGPVAPIKCFAEHRSRGSVVINFIEAPSKTCGSLAADAIVDAVTGKGNVRMDVVLYNTPFYLTLYKYI